MRENSLPVKELDHILMICVDSAGSEGEEAEEVCPICGTNCARANGRPCNEQDESSGKMNVL